MKIKSVSGITCFAKNLSKTAKFYEALGFVIKKRKATHFTAYSNWFWIEFVAVGKDDRATAAYEKANSPLVYLSVDDVDAFYAQLISQKIKPVSQPQNQPWGNREFVVRDPDGYNLVIFKRK
jgi:catechol 2,3-dioxygenase-like lactoylglutathione lyase family enzyme